MITSNEEEQAAPIRKHQAGLESSAKGGIDDGYKLDGMLFFSAPPFQCPLHSHYYIKLFLKVKLFFIFYFYIFQR